MAENEKEDVVGIDGLNNLQNENRVDDHVPGDFADEPRPAPRTENVTAEDPNPGQKVEDQTATDPHPEADEDPEKHIGDEVPDPWAKDATGSWNPIEDDVRIAAEDAEDDEDPELAKKHAENDAAWLQALNGDKEEQA